MNPEYFKTRFRTQEQKIQFPDEFIIITAYPTTGENWGQSKVKGAERQLFEELNSRKTWMVSIEGYSPEAGHAESGWCTMMGFDEACEMGLRYLQDAIFHVKDDLLSVTFCDQRRKLVEIGAFLQRVDPWNKRNMWA